MSSETVDFGITKIKPIAILDFACERIYYGFLLGILGIGILGRVVHFHLTLGSDDQRYIIAARRLIDESAISLHPVYYGRILWRWTLALWGWWPGLTLESSAVLMFLLSCATIFLVAEAGKITFGARAGLLAGAVYASHPLAVLYDVYTLPDNLGVTLLAASVVFFLKYIYTGTSSFLCFAAFVTGLTLGVKEYFVLLAVPFGICLLLEQNRSAKVRNVLLFVFCFAAGVSADFLLHALESGNPFAHWAANANYGDRLLAVDEYAKYSGWKFIARVAIDRLSYIESLFFSFGSIAGFLTLCGLIFTLSRVRGRLDCALLTLGFGVFFFFLSFMPVKLWPIAFVEMQDRYLIVVLPFLSVSAGAALAAALDSQKDRTPRLATFLVLGIASAYNLAIPNNLQDRYRLLEFAGIGQVLNTAPDKRIAELFLPTYYQELTPDSYFSRGTRVKFLTKEDMYSSADQFSGVFENARGQAVFIPRLPYRTLEKFFRAGQAPATEVANLRDGATLMAMKELFDRNRFRKEDVIVPNTSFRFWLDSAGMQVQDQLVGWLYLSK